MYKFNENSIVCFLGDSITFEGGWIRRIYDYYRNIIGVKCEMYNCGVAGSSASLSVGQLDETLFIHNPTDVVIMFGMNDVGRLLYGTDIADGDMICERRRKIDTAVASINAIADKLFQKNIRIIFCTPTPYDELSDFKTEPCLEGVQAVLREVGSRVKHLAKKYGGHVVDFNSKIYAIMRSQYKTNKSVIGADRVHPLPEGYELMAQIFLKSQGFNVTVEEKYDNLKKLSFYSYDEWETKRFELERISLQNHFVNWCLFAAVKDKNIIKKYIQDHIETEQNDFIKKSFELYLTTEHTTANDMKALINHTKSVYKY